MAFQDKVNAEFNPEEPGTSFYQYVSRREKNSSPSVPTYPAVYENSHYGEFYYPTLWGYYNLLPVQLRNHPFIMKALQGFEKYQHRVGPIHP